jgi:hypothetical protein
VREMSFRLPLNPCSDADADADERSPCSTNHVGTHDVLEVTPVGTRVTAELLPVPSMTRCTSCERDGVRRADIENVVTAGRGSWMVLRMQTPIVGTLRSGY